jgi:5-methylthioadenosine/S-adenosylhomocysteine deaminase
MLFSRITYLDADFIPHPDGYVGVQNGKIAYVGDQPPLEDYGETYEGAGKLLLPGFYNAHSHAPMTLLRGYGESLTLHDWLNDRIFPFEDKLTPEDVYAGMLLGIAEMLRFGVVSATDMYYFGDAMCRAVLDAGIKFNVSMGTTVFDDRGYVDLPRYEENESLVRTYHNAMDGALKIDLAIHAEYTSTPKVVAQTAEHAAKLGVRTHVHLSETQSEHEACKARHKGLTPAAYLDSLHFFDTPTTAAHCVWLEEGDVSILAQRGVTAATCPASNLKLASGVCNVPQLLEAGVSVALGTDGVASNNSLNFIEEMKLLSLIQKGRWGDPRLMTPAQTLYAATRAGALSQGREDCGLIQPGFRADLIVLDLSQPYWHPVHDVLNNLVFSASGSDVCLTMVDGRVLYRDGVYPTLDLARILADTERIRTRILAQLA